MAEQNHVQAKILHELTTLADSINEIVESYRKLRSPLVESQERVPRAAEQLDKISAQTEAAAHRMLDVIEGITQREQEVVDDLHALNAELTSDEQARLGGRIDALIAKSQANCDDAYAIMDALQFQDITAQQLGQALSLLEELDTKLVDMVSVLKGEMGQVAGATEQMKKRSAQLAFDPHADMYEKKTNQADIDNMFSQK